jgi:amino acid adenylation domain-containing protein
MTINVLEYLERSVEKFPEKTVFSGPDIQVTYRELHQQAQSIGNFLAARLNGKTNQPVAVIIDRNTSSLVAFMGIVYSGNFYVPIDGNLPLHRVQLILNTLNPQAVLFLHKDVDLLTSLDFRGQQLFCDEAVLYPVDEGRLAEIRKKAIDTDPLCVFFTSGSTGIPKGALINHHSVIDLTDIFSLTFEFSEECVFGNQAPFDFSVSLKDIYSTLKHGATMYIIPSELFSFPLKLIQYLNEKKVNTAIWVTSALRVIANLKGLESEVPLYLRKVLFSGEIMSNRVLNYWRKHLPQITYVNLYGQSEIAYNCTYFTVDRLFTDNELLPAGTPFPNNSVMVINDEGQSVKEGELGEIYVKGSCLALGYYNNPEETARAFCQNPLHSHYPDLVYRTGDLGTYNGLNELLFITRKDDQIKHMGHRIELGEIEVAANALDFIEAACCLHDADADKIVLFYQASQKYNREILQSLQVYLPKYMLPNKLIHYEQLPMNKNAKIDRTKLKEQYYSADRE